VTIPQVRTDEEIRRDVLDELKWDRRFRVHDVDVAVENGVVTLTGWVRYCSEASLAELAARRVLGVRDVVNNIETRVAGCDARGDADLVVDVTRAVHDNVEIRDRPPEVTVEDGWVTLRGEVDWNHIRQAVDNAVKRVPGVRGITSLMTLRPWKKPSADELKNKIEEAMRRNCGTGSRPITVEVEGDTVTLTGTVRTWCEKDAADKIAWFAPGITSVNNRIRVDPEHRPSYVGTGASGTP
jgi:osmotically-inducible protein OsmY